MPARPQHAMHFCKEAADILVVLRGLDIHHRVEACVLERKVVRVRLLEAQILLRREVAPGEVDGSDAVRSTPTICRGLR